MLVNAGYDRLGLEDKVFPHFKVDIIRDYKLLPFGFNGFNGFKRGVKRADLAK